MSKVETEAPPAEAPPAYSPYQEDATAGQTIADPDTDTSDLANYIDTTISLARDTYRSCIKYFEVFDLVAPYVAALFALLEVVIESIADRDVDLDHQMVESMTNLLSAAKNFLPHLQALVARYEELPTAKQRVWMRTMGGAEDLFHLRSQLRENIDLFSALNKKITSTSPKGVLAMVQKFMTEIREGQRKESTVSRKGFAKLSLEDPKTRLQIQQELEDVGITSLLFDQFQDLILQTLTGATDRELAKEFPKATLKESYVPKALGKIKIGRSSSKKPLSLGPSKTPAPGSSKGSTASSSYTPMSGKEKGSTPISSVRTMSGITITSTPHPSNAPTPLGTKVDLFTAIPIDNLARVEELLDHGVDIESRDDVNGGDTPLIKAVKYDKVDIAELLLMRGADANAKTTHSKETALICACASGRYKIILLILELGNPDLDARDRNGRTALMRASAQGYRNDVIAVVRAGADLEAVDRYGRTALMEAARFGHEQTVSILLELGAKDES
ncbi:hypothetical protein VE03_03969 [Pseudogymnoascus sp. 23342-1-I1]|nr:hypothetical protein VE03_03969 [Pseudogymnoascus sp. 23342-1-I1]